MVAPPAPSIERKRFHDTESQETMPGCAVAKFYIMSSPGAHFLKITAPVVALIFAYK